MHNQPPRAPERETPAPMAWGRFISTGLGTDVRLRNLIRDAGTTSALLYTWMIPHADGQGRVKGTPWEIKTRIIGAVEDLAEEDIAHALDTMERHGLVTWDRDANLIWLLGAQPRRVK